MVGLLDILSPVLGPIIERVFPDPVERQKYELQLAQLADQEAQRQHDENMGQIGTNTAEANNQNLFVAGWRPFVGWVCGIGVAYSFIIEPVGEFTAKLAGYTGAFPVLDMGNLMTLIMGMLGMGYLRTKEKLGGIPDSLGNASSTPVSDTVGQPAAPKVKKKVLGIEWPF